MSELVRIKGGTDLKTGVFVSATLLSGGTQLSTSGITTYGINIKNTSLTISGRIHVGSSGNPPYLSGGYVLLPGESQAFNVCNPAFIRVFSSTLSGTDVCWYGITF